MLAASQRERGRTRSRYIGRRRPPPPKTTLAAVTMLVFGTVSTSCNLYVHLPSSTRANLRCALTVVRTGGRGKSPGFGCHPRCSQTHPLLLLLRITAATILGSRKHYEQLFCAVVHCGGTFLVPRSSRSWACVTSGRGTNRGEGTIF